MSARVVRVVADQPAPAVPRRVTLGLAELVLAARLAGDVPLPVRTDGVVDDDRLHDRLDGTPASRAQDVLRRELERVDDGSARSSLVEQRLLDDDGALDLGLLTALHVLAGAPLCAVLDVTARRRAGDVRLRSWFGVGPGLAAQLTTGSSLELELAWFEPRLWVTQLTRAVTVEPWVPEAAPLSLPGHVVLPSELLAGATKAHRDQRTDLLEPMAAAHVGAVRLAGRPADSAEVLALLSTLTGSCRGRLRLLTTRRDRPDPGRGVASWLLFDDGWHELRPDRGATSVLPRRDARDLGLVTLPLVEEVA